MTLPALLHVDDFPDRTTYHLGTIWSGTPQHLPTYTTNAGAQPPDHWWNARLVDRKQPIQVVRSPAQIVALNRMFPFGDTGCKLGAAATDVPCGPMGASDVPKYMPTTGERAAIGLVTDNSASYMLGNSAQPMINWMLANEACPMHFRDEHTGKPIDPTKYPMASCYWSPNGTPWMQRGPAGPDGTGNVWGGDWTPQQAHYTEMSYLAHIATLDPSALENVQYNAVFAVACDTTLSTPARAVPSGELRGLAWAFRNLFMAHVATLDAEKSGTLPSTCLPSSVFKKVLDDTLAVYSKVMTDPNQQVFRLVSGSKRFGIFQVDYMLTALAFGVLTGHSDWTPLYLWALGNAVARTNGNMTGTGGYPPGYGAAYYMNVARGGDPSDGWDTSKVPVPADKGKIFTSWAESFQDMQLYGAAQGSASGLTQAQYDALLANPLNGGKGLTLAESMMTTRAALVMALRLEDLGLLPGLRAQYPEIDTCFTNADRMVRNNGSMNLRASYVRDASKVPGTIPPLPPVTPPPTPPPISTGDITVSDIAFNAPFTATVSFKDNTGANMVPDSVSWSAPDGLKLTADQTNKLAAHGVYGVAGLSVIKAVGVKAGISVTVSKEVTIPEAVPFLATGEIILS